MSKPPVTPIFPRNGNIIENKIEGAPCSEEFNNGRNYPNIPYQHPSIGIPSNSTVIQNFPQFPLNCLSIAQHIETCPICSKLHDTDKTLYVLVIAGLLILIFLLVRRILQL